MLQFIALGVIFSISLTFQSISFAQEVVDIDQAEFCKR